MKRMFRAREIFKCVFTFTPDRTLKSDIFLNAAHRVFSYSIFSLPQYNSNQRYYCLFSERN